jgi:branched-chain amino acid transport system permease protein
VRRERLDRGIKVRCDDIYAVASWREILYLAGPRALAVAGLLVFPLLRDVVGTYWQAVYLITLAIVLLAVSWDLLASTGLLSLGHAFFFGVGAYAAAYLGHTLGWPPLLAIPAGTIGGALVITALLRPALELRGIYFSLITFALPLLSMRIVEATRVLGGTEGLSGLPAPPPLAAEQYVLIGAVLVVVFGLQRLLSTDYGLVLRAIRENDRSVLASGVPIGRHKAQAVFLAALPACLAGGFLTYHYQAVGIAAFALDYSLLPLTAAIVGGQGSIVGAAVGAFILVPLSEALRAFGTLRVVAYSLLLVLFVVAIPEGIFHYLRRRYHQYERQVVLD